MGERHQYRGYRFRLAATAEQMALIGQFSSVCRAIYNAALEQRRDWWRHHKRCTGSAISFASQCRELTELRREFDWIAAVPRMMQEQALRDLDAAYANFFSRRTAYPSFRRRGVGESFRVRREELIIRPLNAKWCEVRLPKIGIRQKAGLNRSILNQGWGAFASILAYKLEERGGSLVLVDPAYTSQACSECGIVDRESRKSQAAFVCQHCGFRAHADHNAAINILRRNTASMRVEDGHRAADEARTNNRADSMGMLICSASALKLGVHGRR